MTENHDYNTPARGAQNWDEPLNANFEQLETDVEIRDTTANLSQYTPEEGAKFLATDSGVVYAGVDVGDGETNIQWVRQGVMPHGEGFANEARSEFAVVVGGLDNRASGPRAVVLGGKSNVASGRSAVAAGKRARAAHDGTVVFGDHTGAPVSSNGPGELRSQMPVYAPAFHTTSARAKKTDIDAFDPQDALDGVENLSIHSWRLAHESDTADTDTAESAGRHVGPVAEDFHDQFDLAGEDSIATVDADGVALAAIQALSKHLDEQRTRIDNKSERIGKLEDRMERKENRVEQLERENERLRERLTAIEANTEMTAKDTAQTEGQADE
jgi:flagellin-like hook-associated protein FlgL